jgi:hypothetical protein
MGIERVITWRAAHRRFELTAINIRQLAASRPQQCTFQPLTTLLGADLRVADVFEASPGIQPPEQTSA